MNLASEVMSITAISEIELSKSWRKDFLVFSDIPQQTLQNFTIQISGFTISLRLHQEMFQKQNVINQQIQILLVY